MERIRLEHLLDEIRKRKILVVGDLILDRYLFGKVDRISPEAPVPIVEVEKEEHRLGGACNVANNLRALGAEVYLCGIVGKDTGGEILKKLLKDKGIKDLTVEDAGRKTTVKTRIISMSQQLIRIDEEDKRPASGKVLSNLLEMLDVECECIIVSDYAKGCIVPDLMRKIRNKKVVWSVDPKPKNVALYSGATLMTPNEKEVREITRSEDIIKGAITIREELGIDTIAITRGPKGITLVRDSMIKSFPALAKQVYDVTGAGDTVIAVMSALMLSSASWEEICIIANISAGISVGKIGTSTVSREEILSYAEEGEIVRRHSL